MLEAKIITFVRLLSVNRVQKRTKRSNGIERLSCVFLHFVVLYGFAPSAGRSCAHNPKVVKNCRLRWSIDPEKSQVRPSVVQI